MLATCLLKQTFYPKYPAGKLFSLSRLKVCLHEFATCNNLDRRSLIWTKHYFIFCRLIINIRSGFQNHYDTLGLKQNCTGKDVKDAFVSLSKAHHPDLHQNDPSQQEKFVEIYEAYSVLSRPEKRLTYDSDLSFREKTGNGPRMTVETDAPHYTTWKDESIWSMRDKTSENFDRSKPYYGIRGINRMSNYWIAGGAMLVMVIGALMHYTFFKHSLTFTVSQLDTRDEKLAKELFRTRLNAQKNGNTLQLELLKEKLGWSEETGNDTKKDKSE